MITTIRPELLVLNGYELAALASYFIVLGGAVLGIFASILKERVSKWPIFLFTVGVCAAGFATSWGLITNPSLTLFNGMMASDGFSHFFNAIFLASAGLTALVSFRYLDREGIQHPEYYILLLFSALGMMLMVSALDLVVIFISLEIMSLSIYTLVGFRRSDRKSNEAALKYFIMGGAASAIFLYGVALLYGVSGTTNIRGILEFGRSQAGEDWKLFAFGLWLVISGFLFKVAAAPFHMWMPDVYEGAPVPITGFMATGVKAAAFGVFIRVFAATGYGSGLAEGLSQGIHDLIWICAVATMVIGNLVALTQTQLKRMLAYSSIAHTGYLLVGLLACAHNEQGYAPMVLYLVSYSVMNMGAFAVLGILSSRLDEGLTLQDWSGVARRHPWLAFAMAVFMLSMAGVPPTAGFVAKYVLFYSAVQASELVLVVIAVLTSAVSVYYYFRVLVYMYMREPMGASGNERIPLWSALVLAAMVFLTLQIGILPEAVVEAANAAITGL